MRFDLVKKITFHKLNDGYDRRGPIMTMELEDVKNREYALACGAEIIAHVSMLLSDHYDQNQAHDAPFGEQNDSWIKPGWYVIPTVVLQHKYWGERQLSAFYEIMDQVAVLHRWEVEDNSAK